ncbi:surfeit locus protein 6 [Clinocottus analis]|uniref:surfeit locus protein 6 n=1 Tax=Clinocottus analis TaxID=304258 RepID=UPI0035BF8861
MDLASRDSYIQKFASKVFSQRDQEPKKRPFAYSKVKSDAGPPQKKKKCKKKHFKEKATDEKRPAPKSQQKPSPCPAAQKGPAPAKLNGSKAQSMNAPLESSFSTVDVLRKRLHEKIEQSRGQGAPKDAASEAVLAKRAKRKIERERKKRKRKEFRLKKIAEESAEEPRPEIKQEAPRAPAASKRNETAILFNTVETVEEGYMDKIQKKKNKKLSMKGQLTPLTGRNYKQLLERVEARKEKLEKLRETDEGKARELEEKMKWTNVLYKAEGLKIKDDEAMLRSSLKRKEKTHAAKQRQWAERSENVVGKMQRRQDKRRKNIQKHKKVKTEKKKDQARKRGRVLPEDLKKVIL